MRLFQDFSLDIQHWILINLRSVYWVFIRRVMDICKLQKFPFCFFNKLCLTSVRFGVTKCLWNKIFYILMNYKSRNKDVCVSHCMISCRVCSNCYYQSLFGSMSTSSTSTSKSFHGHSKLRGWRSAGAGHWLGPGHLLQEPNCQLCLTDETQGRQRPLLWFPSQPDGGAQLVSIILQWWRGFDESLKLCSFSFKFYSKLYVEILSRKQFR